MVAGMTEALDDLEDDVALQTLLQLDAGGGGTLDPELVAGICGHDQRRVLRLLRVSEQQEIAWREARDAARESGDAGEARACAHELRARSGTSDLLRKVLWLVVRGGAVGQDPPADVPRPDPVAPVEHVRSPARLGDGVPAAHGRSGRSATPPISPRTSAPTGWRPSPARSGLGRPPRSGSRTTRRSGACRRAVRAGSGLRVARAVLGAHESQRRGCDSPRPSQGGHHDPWSLADEDRRAG